MMKNHNHRSEAVQSIHREQRDAKRTEHSFFFELVHTCYILVCILRWWSETIFDCLLVWLIGHLTWNMIVQPPLLPFQVALLSNKLSHLQALLWIGPTKCFQKCFRHAWTYSPGLPVSNDTLSNVLLPFNFCPNIPLANVAWAKSRGLLLNDSSCRSLHGRFIFQFGTRPLHAWRLRLWLWFGLCFGFLLRHLFGRWGFILNFTGLKLMASQIFQIGALWKLRFLTCLSATSLWSGPLGAAPITGDFSLWLAAAASTATSGLAWAASGVGSGLGSGPAVTSEGFVASGLGSGPAVACEVSSSGVGSGPALTSEAGSGFVASGVGSGFVAPGAGSALSFGTSWDSTWASWDSRSTGPKRSPISRCDSRQRAGLSASNGLRLGGARRGDGVCSSKSLQSEPWTVSCLRAAARTWSFKADDIKSLKTSRKSVGKLET